MAQDDKKLNKVAKIAKIAVLVLLAFIVLIIIIAVATAKKDEQPALADIMNKCTVMEAYDIYNTNIVAPTNAFDEANETCNNLFEDIYGFDREAFTKDVLEDWDSKKNEQIDGNNMQYYLEILERE